MRKLNRKGFTLVELLAVIIILAIVVGISIPAITNTINDSKNNALGIALNSAEKWFSEQAALIDLDYNSANTHFKNKFTSSTGTVTLTTTDADLLKAAGLSTNDISEMDVEIRMDGSTCVTVKKIPVASEYYSTKYWTASGTSATPKTGASYTSKGC